MIYTRRNAWNNITGGDEEEITGIPLWDARYAKPPNEELADLNYDLDGPWQPYGSWTNRSGKQYGYFNKPTDLSPTSLKYYDDTDENLAADPIVSNPSAFALAKPSANCKPSLGITEQISGSGSGAAATVTITGTLNNISPSPKMLSDALAVRITDARLMGPLYLGPIGVQPITATPAYTAASGSSHIMRLGTIPVFGTAPFSMTSPSVGKSGALDILQLKGTYGGGTFRFSLRVPMP